MLPINMETANTDLAYECMQSTDAELNEHEIIYLM